MAPHTLASLLLVLLVQQSAVMADQKVFDITACPDYATYAAYPQFVHLLLRFVLVDSF